MNLVAATQDIATDGLAVDLLSPAERGFGNGLQVLTIAGYAGLALGHPGFGALSFWCAMEHFASGMATAALFTCRMDWCSETAAATDYTVQACAVVIATGAGSSLAGFSAQAIGYFAHFALSGALALLALLAVWQLFPTPAAVRALTTAAPPADLPAPPSRRG